MVKDELDSLWREQQKHHPTLLTDELRQKIEQITLSQRPSFFRRRTFGRCVLEPTEERALKAEWLTQRFEMLQLVNALKLEGGNQRHLDEIERRRAFNYLESVARPTWAELREAVELGRSDRFTHERGKKETVRGNATEAALRAALGAGFPDHSAADTIRAAIGEAWHRLEYRPAKGGAILEIRDAAGIKAERDKLASHAQTAWSLSENEARKLAEIDLPDGTGRHSLKAMRRMLPHLEAGAPYMTALQQEYAPRDSTEPLHSLPGPNPGELARIKDSFVRQRMESLLAGIRNPTVLRTLGELQKVVNTLLRVHGRPDLIRIEFARDLKQSVADRRKTDSNQTKREKARAEARKKLAELGKAAEGPEGEENVMRFLLWQEQGGRCPYSGKALSCADALSAEATEIDHIFPISRSFDDSQANKLLCFVKENRDKKNQTPYEWLNPQEHLWQYLTGTLWPQMEAAGWPKTKRRRCEKPALEQAEEDAFTHRQLVDTAFISRAARDYLGLLFGGGQAGMDAVQVVPGRATALLRRTLGIGLGRLLQDKAEGGPKARDDLRHHAVDALTVALTGPGTVHKLSRWWQEREMRHTRPSFPPPWPGFSEQTKARVEAIVVSHRVQAKLSGPLHEETRLGDTGVVENGFRLYVKRKPVADLSANEIMGKRDVRIADGGVQRAIVDHLNRHDITDPKTADNKKLKAALAAEIRLPRADGSSGPLIRRVRLLIRRNEGMMRTHATRNIHAELGPGSLHHIAIYVDGDDVRFLVVSKREAAERLHRGEPVACSRHPEGGRLAMALCPGDVVHRRVDDRDEFALIRLAYSNGQIFYKPLAMAGVPAKEVSKKPKIWIREGWRKVAVDPIGRVRPAR